MNVHRHFRKSDDTLFLFNISYEINHGVIILRNFTMHKIENEIVGPNCVKHAEDDYTEYALANILQILYDDGVV